MTNLHQLSRDKVEVTSNNSEKHKTQGTGSVHRRFFIFLQFNFQFTPQSIFRLVIVNKKQLSV